MKSVLRGLVVKLVFVPASVVSGSVTLETLVDSAAADVKEAGVVALFVELVVDTMSVF